MFLKDFFQKVNFEKVSRLQQKHSPLYQALFSAVLQRKIQFKWDKYFFNQPMGILFNGTFKVRKLTESGPKMAYSYRYEMCRICNIQLPWWNTNSVDIGQTSYGGRSTTN